MSGPDRTTSAYAAAGVDIEAGDRAVELMKAHVAATCAFINSTARSPASMSTPAAA